LTNGKGFYSPLVYVLECHRLGIPLLPPSVNEPGPAFSVSSGPFPLTPALSLRERENRIPFLEKPKRSALIETRATTFLPHESARGSERKGLLSLSSRGGEGESSGTRTVRGFETRTTALPLPKGEGQGEGEETAQSPTHKRIHIVANKKIRVPLLNVKGLTLCTKESILRERSRGAFSSLTDFVLRVQPLPEEMESLIRVGAFDDFGKPRTAQYWEFKGNAECPDKPPHPAPRPPHFLPASGSMFNVPPPKQPWLLPPADLTHLPSVPLAE